MNDVVAGEPVLVVWGSEGTASPLDSSDIAGGRSVGAGLAYLRTVEGRVLTFDAQAALSEDPQQAAVRRIYHERYWLPASCPEMPPALAFFHFDCAVNQGVTGAARLLQEAVGAVIDGEIGPETLDKAAARPMDETLTLYADARRRHYRSLSTFWRFGRGWLARVDRTLLAAIALAAATARPGNQERADRGTPTADVQQVPQQPKEITPMSDTTQAPMTPQLPDSKWWGQSMTIWGVIITALSTVLPAVGPLIGLDITAELVRQLGDQIVAVVQALGGLIGTILAIWGRARATAPLERRQLTMNL